MGKPRERIGDEVPPRSLHQTYKHSTVNLGTWTGPYTRIIAVGAFDLLSALRDEIVEHALRHMHEQHLLHCLWSRVSPFSPPMMDSKLSKPDAKKSNLGSRRIPGAYPRGLPSTTCRWARKVELPLTATLYKPTLAKASQGVCLFACLFVCDYAGMCVLETSVGPCPPIQPPLPSFHANAYKKIWCQGPTNVLASSCRLQPIP